MIIGNFPTAGVEKNEMAKGLVDGTITTLNVDTTTARDIFQGLTSLEKVVMPELLSVSADMFTGCTSLTHVDMAKVRTINGRAFSGCSNLSVLIAPELEDLGVFACQSTKLVELYLPNCHTLLNDSLRDCTLLERVEMGNPTYLANRVFYGCANLTTFIARATSDLYSINANVFQGTAIEAGAGYIYLPDAYSEAAKSTSGWSTYAAQIKPISELP